jgi:RHS repeat-associated protein
MSTMIHIVVVLSMILSAFMPYGVQSNQLSQTDRQILQASGPGSKTTPTPTTTSPSNPSTATPQASTATATSVPATATEAYPAPGSDPTATTTTAPTGTATSVPTNQPDASTPVPTQQPSTDSFKLSAKRISFIPGDIVSVNWSSANKSTNNQKLLVKMPADWILPDQAQALVQPVTQDPNQKQKSEIVVSYPDTGKTGTIRFQTTALSEDTQISIENWDGNTLKSTQYVNLLAVTRITLNKQGGSVEGKASGGTVRLTIPNGTLDDFTDIQIQSPQDLPQALPLNGSKPFQLNAINQKSGAQIHKFSGKIDIAIPYDPAQNPVDPSKLSIYWMDEETGAWRVLPGTFDYATNTYIAQTDHFSLFSLGENSWESKHVPPLDAAEVSGFTGAATYSMKLEVPSGPGGIAPSISLSYNSANVEGIQNLKGAVGADSVTDGTQPSWVGLGWNLSSGGQILRNMGKKQDTDLDDTYSLVVGGIAVDLVPISAHKTSNVIDYIDYRASDENFWLIRRFKSTGTRLYWTDDPMQHGSQAPSEDDYWVAWDTQGMRYEFRERAYYVEVNQNADTSIPRNCVASGINKVCTFRPWSWLLTYSYNPSGQMLSYAYNTDDQDKKKFADNFFAKVHQAIYPSEIQYPDGRTKIVFTLDKNGQGVSNRRDYDWYWGDAYTNVRYEKSRLKSVQVMVDGTISREYVMTYFTNGTLPIFTKNMWTPSDPATITGRPTDTDSSLVLKSIAQYGTGGLASGQSLPAVEFTYGAFTLSGTTYNTGDQMHLSQVHNGYGGVVSFVYESTPWFDPDHIAKSKEVDLLTNQNLSFNDVTDEVAIYEKAMQVMLGNAYRISCQIDTQYSGAIHFELRNLYNSSTEVSGETKTFAAGNNQWVSGIVLLPVDSNQGTAQIQYVSGAGYTVKNCKGGPIVTQYRVTQRIVSDEVKAPSNNGNPITYTYSYAYSGATLIIPHTTTPEAGNSDYALLQEDLRSPASEPYSGFRGHSSVTVTDPGQKKTTTYFFQTDLLKGKVDKVEVRDIANVLYSIQDYSYDSPSQVAFSGNQNEVCAGNSKTQNIIACFQDQKIYFISVDKVENKTFNASGTAVVGTQDDYTYDPTYGNLTQVQKSVWESSAWKLVSVTKYGYKPSRVDGGTNIANTKNLVGLLGSSSLYKCDSNGCSGLDHLVSYSCTIYDAPTGGGSGKCAIYQMNTSIQEDLDDLDGGLPTGTRKLLRFGTVTNIDYTAPQFTDSRTRYDSMGNPVVLTMYGTEGDKSGLSSGSPHVTEQCFGVADAQTGCADAPYKSRVLWSDNPDSRRTTYQYDALLGVPTSETDPNGATAYALYDVFGRMTLLILPGDSNFSPTMSISYSASTDSPFWISVSHKGGSGISNTVRKIYDGLGRVVQTQQAYAFVNADYKDILTDTSYDFAGRAIWQTVPIESTMYDGSTPLYRPLMVSTSATTTTYDSLGRVTKVKTPDATDANAMRYTYDFDLGGNRLKTMVTDRLNNVTTTFIDGLGQTRQIVPATGPGTVYSYDAAGQLTSTTYGSAVTSLEYDLAGRKIKMMDADMGMWQYGYDALGNLKNQVDAKNQKTCLYYDVLNRLKAKNYQGNGTNCPDTQGSQPTVSYTYDQTSATNNGIGRRTGMSDSSGTTSWEYDLRGRVIHETRNVTDGMTGPSLGTYHTYWSYNSDNSVWQMVLPNMETLNFAYTPQGTIRQVYSILNGATADITKQYVADTTYSAAGQVKVRTLGNGVTQSYDYYGWTEQGSGRLKTLTAALPGVNPQTYQSITYTYDLNANIHTITDTVANGDNLTFTYDALNRLDLVTGSYAEDPAYNVATGTISSRNGVEYKYDDLSHPHAVTSTKLNNQLLSSYIYDANGNMQSRNISSGNYTLIYDEENRLSQITVMGASMSARYVYDGDGKRVIAVLDENIQGKTPSRTVYIGGYFEAQTSSSTMVGITMPAIYGLCHDSSRCKRVYLPMIQKDDANPTFIGMTSGNFGNTYLHTHQETPPPGVTWRIYYASGAALRVRTNNTDDLYYILTDHLGGTSKTISETGTVTGEIHYKAWGETRTSTGSIPTQKKYTGQLETEAGLYYYGARFYDPALGRFSSPDTIISNTYNPGNWDRFSYTNNNPINYNDPSGHARKDMDSPGCFDETCRVISKVKADAYSLSKKVADSSTSEKLSYIALALDYSAFFLSGIEAGASDAAGAVFVAVGCGGGGVAGGITVPAGCGAGLGVGLGFDFVVSGMTPLAGAENFLGLSSLLVTATSDFLSGYNKVDFRQGNLQIGKDTVVSMRNFFLGQVPESNWDAWVSMSQVKYDTDRILGTKQGGSYELFNNWKFNPIEALWTGYNFYISDWW